MLESSLHASGAMKITKTVSWKSLYTGPQYFVDFLATDRFKEVFHASCKTQGIRSLGWTEGFVDEFYDYYSWSDTGKLFGITSANPKIDPRRGWMVCVFDVKHPDPKSLNIYQAIMLAEPADIRHWSQAFPTKKALITALETENISWKRMDYGEAGNNQWIK